MFILYMTIGPLITLFFRILLLIKKLVSLIYLAMPSSCKALSHMTHAISHIGVGNPSSSLRVSLFGSEIGRMENFGEKM